MKWLYLDFYNLQLDQVYQHNRDPYPLAIIDPLSNEITQLNHEAYDKGVRLGMGLASSVALCNNLNILELNTEIEVETLTHIADELYNLVADIILDPPNGLFIKLSTMYKLYNSQEQCWDYISKKLQQLPNQYTYASSHSALSAKLLSLSKLNKLITNKCEAIELVSELSIETLPVANKSKEALIRVGIKKLGQLLSIPLKELSTRFDISLITAIGQLTGELSYKGEFYTRPQTFNKTIELLFEIRTTSLLLKPLSSLLKQLEKFTKLRCLTFQALNITLLLADGNKQNISVKSASQQNAAAQWHYLLSLKFEKIKLLQPVRGIILSVPELFDFQTSSGSFFSDNQATHSINEFLSILKIKLGDDSVHFPYLKDQHLPEQHSQLIKEPQQVEYKSASDHNTPTPLFLLERPVPLTEEVSLKSTIERVASNWWQGHQVSRDYYLAETNTGQWLWVFRRPDKKWFIHGYYG